MSSVEIFFDHPTEAFEPDEIITAVARWQLSYFPSGAEMRLFWYTKGKGDQDVEIVSTQKLDAAGTSGEQRFSFQLPKGPFSFSGKLISVIWALELVFSPSGATARKEFVMAPGRLEQQLSAIN